MTSWWPEYCADSIAKARLLFLRERGLEMIEWVNEQPVFDPCDNQYRRPQEKKFMDLVERLRESIKGSGQLARICKLRLVQVGVGEAKVYDHLHTRHILTTTVLNIESEIEAIERRTNFRITIATALFAIVSTLFAFVAAVADSWSAWVKL